MHLITLTNDTGSSARAGWHVRDLRRAAAAARHTFLACSWRALTASLALPDQPVARAGDITLDHAHAILLRTMPPGSLEQIVFRMDLLQQLDARGIPIINPPRAIEIAVDKYLCLAKLHDAGLPVPPTIVCQRARDAVDAFNQLGGDVIVKPIFGSEGVGMTRISDVELLRRAAFQLERMGSAIYLQQTIRHAGEDLRLFLLGDRIVAAMRRIGSTWKTNVAQGAAAVPHMPSDEEIDIARRAAAACSTHLAGVDIVRDHAGRAFVLEVNAVPGWRKLCAVAELDIAALIVDDLAQRARERTVV